MNNNICRTSKISTKDEKRVYEPTFIPRNKFVVLRCEVETYDVSVVGLTTTHVNAVNLLNISIDKLKSGDKRRKEDDYRNFYETVIENSSTYNVFERFIGNLYSSKILKFIFFIKKIDDDMTSNN